MSYSELAREKMWSRIHLIPLLQAEEDRDQVRRYYADKAREKALLGTETKVYNSDRYAAFLIYIYFSWRSILISSTDSSAPPSRTPRATWLSKLNKTELGPCRSLSVANLMSV